MAHRAGPAVLILALLAGCGESDRNAAKVVVYTSVDQVYAERIIGECKETGLNVAAVFDAEANKTTGLFGRLMAERTQPRADVFWNGEACRTLQLVESGLAEDISDLVPENFPRKWIDPEGRWVAFSLRARVIVFNTNLVKREDVPRTLEELTRPEWKGKVAIAKPLFGTTATHMAALYEVLGEERAEQLLRALKANDVRVVEGNSVVRDVVARGEVPVGLTDTDDVFAGIEQGMDIDFVLPDQDGIGTLAIPNTVMILKGGPNPEGARLFVKFLLAPKVEEMLAFERARQIPVRDEILRPEELKRFVGIKSMDVDYAKVAARMPDAARRVEQIFLR